MTYLILLEAFFTIIFSLVLLSHKFSLCSFINKGNYINPLQVKKSETMSN